MKTCVENGPPKLDVVDMIHSRSRYQVVKPYRAEVMAKSPDLLADGYISLSIVSIDVAFTIPPL